MTVDLRGTGRRIDECRLASTNREEGPIRSQQKTGRFINRPGAIFKVATFLLGQNSSMTWSSHRALDIVWRGNQREGSYIEAAPGRPLPAYLSYSNTSKSS